MRILSRVYPILYREVSRIFVLHTPQLVLNWFYKKYRKKGEKLYSKIKREYGEDTYLVLCPYPGTGDVYIAAINFKEYMMKNNIRNVTWVVIGAANKKVVGLFGYKQIYQITNEAMHDLVKFLMFLGIDERNCLLAHPSSPYMHYGINDMLRNYGELNFSDMYQYGVFGIAENYIKEKAQFSEKNEAIINVIKKNRLKKGKTVILSPYANTLQVLPDWFWRKLVSILKTRGFCVLTNSSGTHEPAIEGTNAIFLPYKDLKYFLEYCGYFIGVRSGLCDIISDCVCKKVIIYQPYCFWGPAGNWEYFSLNRMGLCDDAIELSYDGVEYIKLIYEIVNEVGLQN